MAVRFVGHRKHSSLSWNDLIHNECLKTVASLWIFFWTKAVKIAYLAIWTTGLLLTFNCIQLNAKITNKTRTNTSLDCFSCLFGFFLPYNQSSWQACYKINYKAALPKSSNIPSRNKCCQRSIEFCKLQDVFDLAFGESPELCDWVFQSSFDRVYFYGLHDIKINVAWNFISIKYTKMGRHCFFRV